MPVLRTTQGHEEFEEAKREGIAFLPRRGPKRFLGERPPRGDRAARACCRCSTRTAASRPQYDDADVIHGRGRRLHPRDRPEARPRFLTPADGVALTPGGTIRVDPETLATSAPGVFAGGDVAFGPRNLIEAVANGKRAARSIHEHLRAGARALETTLEIEKLPTSRYRMIAGFERARPRGAADARRSAAAPASPRSRPATTAPQAGSRRRAASSATCRRSTTPRSACCAAAAWTSAPSTASRSCRSRTSTCPRPRRTRCRAGRGERPAALRDGQGRRPLHPLRPVRHPLPDRRDDDGAVPDHGALRCPPRSPHDGDEATAATSCSRPGSAPGASASPRRRRPRCARSCPTSPTTRRRR